MTLFQIPTKVVSSFCFYVAWLWWNLDLIRSFIMTKFRDIYHDWSLMGAPKNAEIMNLYQFCWLESRKCKKSISQLEALAARNSTPLSFIVTIVMLAFVAYCLFSKDVEYNMRWQNPLKLLLVFFCLINDIVNQITDMHLKPMNMHLALSEAFKLHITFESITACGCCEITS